MAARAFLTARLLSSSGTRPICRWPVRSGRRTVAALRVRRFVHGQENVGGGSPSSETFLRNFEKFKQYFCLPEQSRKSSFEPGKTVTVNGFLSSRRVKHSRLVFADIDMEGESSVQITSRCESPDHPGFKTKQDLCAIPLNSPVSITGTIVSIDDSRGGRVDIDLESVQALNAFPRDINIGAAKQVQFPPQKRHLDIRFSNSLRSRLIFRHHVASQLRRTLAKEKLQEYETPVLFKSTPEGAREFLVPTRRAGQAYALPQSPQQYKQILMASGVRGYYQFARCFRDEDLRADRQPEFTQLDLEVSFATGREVIHTVEVLIRDLLQCLGETFFMVKAANESYPVTRKAFEHQKEAQKGQQDASYWPLITEAFPRISYQESMTRFGSDKPDLRIPFEIHRVDHVLPKSFVSMITDCENPIVEAFKIRPDETVYHGLSSDTFRHMSILMSKLPHALASNPDGAPTMLVFQSQKPLNGLSSLGFQGVASIASLPDFSDLQESDILVFQARPNKPFYGGSTALGTLRSLFYDELVSLGFLPHDPTFRFLWVTEFPLFTPSNDADPGQGGRSGFSSTHHPFTAPLTEDDFSLLATDPLSAKADHYDLVVNGMELGGGSRRIHVAEVQEYVMRSVLQMDNESVGRFAHLLDALRAGCPPHAGFAFGFDRLVATLSGTESIRDVIAFPKSMKGEDLMVRSPGRIGKEELKVYHLAFRKTEEAP